MAEPASQEMSPPALLLPKVINLTGSKDSSPQDSESDQDSSDKAPAQTSLQSTTPQHEVNDALQSFTQPVNLASLSQASKAQAEKRSIGNVWGASTDGGKKRKTKASENSSKKRVDGMARLSSQPNIAAVMASNSSHEQTAAGSLDDGVAHAAAVELLSSRQQLPVPQVSPTCCAKDFLLQCASKYNACALSAFCCQLQLGTVWQYAVHT